MKENQLIAHQSQKMLSANEMRGNLHHYEEHIEIDKAGGAFEKIEVPHFEAFRQATILHDFQLVRIDVIKVFGTFSLKFRKSVRFSIPSPSINRYFPFQLLLTYKS